MIGASCDDRGEAQRGRGVACGVCDVWTACGLLGHGSVLSERVRSGARRNVVHTSSVDRR